MAKAKLNYWVDVIIGLAFIFSALSGMVLFFAPSGYQGGRNPYYLETVLLLTTHQWGVVHTWSSIAMIAGTGAHLVLHWNWMVCMTVRLLEGLLPSKAKQEACPIE